MSTQIRALQDLSVETPRLMSLATLKFQIMQPITKMFLFKRKNAMRMHQFFIVLTAALFFVSCQKEELSNPVLNSTGSDALSELANKNKAPTVDAGEAQRVVYPSSTSTTLHGSGWDNHGQADFEWKQVGGKSDAKIAKPNSATTTVSNLKPGVYIFTLTAKDHHGTSRTDTTTVSVLEKITWTVDGVTREALVHPSNSSTPPPIIFAFHGHGGTALGFAEKGFELEWPEAVVLYPQGLHTTSHGDKEGKCSGWQHSIGEVNNHTGIKDQDIKFFDAMLATYQTRYHTNPKLVFAHGWSNGGSFVYNVLWATRAEKLTALAPAAATLGSTNGKRTIPVIHTAGTHDDQVSFGKQEQSGQNVRNLNKCSNNGDTWATGSSGLLGKRYASSINKPEVFLQYDGGHSYPFTVPSLIIKFFKEVAEK